MIYQFLVTLFESILGNAITSSILAKFYQKSLNNGCEWLYKLALFFI